MVKKIIFDTPRIIEFVDRINNSRLSHASAIGLESDGQLIAGIVYENYNRASVCMHSASNRSHWLTRSFLWMCFDYPFNQLGVKKILGLVAADNSRARRFNEHLGFVLEHSIQDAAPDGALCIYSMTRNQCRFIVGGKNYGQ